MAKQLSDREINAILFKLRDKLDFKERAHVEELLKRAREGGLYKEELRKELLKLRAAFKISEGDRAAIEEAIFEKD
ncbi:hypothetical protein A3B21_04395 [Candidatus Uhrbacteria bacterium RIFCSPLOWO2_01_FULL_47_24]|uniref:Uncharacterized protein n=1 Tax=Candidatus Uhrbacteria bacterium RIFCSPLOWO2_01_FULL_47_24 TaxID=1802401 RepID=A0A1F7UTN4_9BACT|nr:MAG: hypothetical protein A2753_01045 [Candidatus Uhrbacteria bacterium RIFCSPHIGHO2_01_FULL_47_11]OGL68961.1 MAG: hypothetical protein A3D58_00465 [Candidatus Uhrbacteria bacterium RIFCSPHIGHO2_02_FULL_46_47]OGL74922.1 MAG: hypothetical protein A3F52_02040 [Candidatus Uhrbacteria bacterium RIFCSPHIGHO2_12_FULL_47_11]OGL81663.1 MAG: hypothetical protein A3B21_04395 [Candidatus Uhrbacteria bacterium RIFCSPLOWO2_01_FULL_47_24]OGL85084.1 MAG: hypothetical protein A3J03_03920 [Candidatus Uhrbact